MSLRDRGWLPVDTVRAVGPLRGITAQAVREALIRLHHGYPHHRLVCQMDTQRYRWATLSGPEFAARAHGMVAEIDARGQSPADAACWRVVDEPLGDRPVFFAICGPFLAMKFSHALGDGRPSNAFLPEIINAAVENRAPVPPFLTPVRLPLLRASLRHFGRHPGQLLHAVRVRRPPVMRAPADELMVAWKPQMAHCTARSTVTMLREWRAWRSANVPEASMASVEFAAIVAALERCGIGTDRPGFVTLIDARRYLAPNQTVDGNFSAGQFLTPQPLTDPRAVDRELKREIATGRTLALMAMRDAHFLLAPAHAAAPRQTTVRTNPRPELTLTHIGRIDALSGIPWDGPQENRQSLSLPTPGGPEAITISIAELFGALHLNATFHSSTFQPEAVGQALNLVCQDPISLLQPLPAGGRSG
jgi:hypothetical protein